MTVLVVTAVENERDAVMRGAGCPPSSELNVIVAGVGPVAAAVSTATALARLPEISLVISAGIGGGFRDRIDVGDIAVADRVTFADLGVRTATGFLSLNDMGLHQDSCYSTVDSDLRARLASTSLRVVSGEILTLACMTGTDDDATHLAARHPNAVAEAMEGFGVAAAARHAGLPFAEIRAISNVIGRREPSTWNMQGAFDALAQAFATLTTASMKELSE